MLAQNNMGVLYANGQGVDKDLVEAVRWYRKAAEQGHAQAQTNLGFTYANGRGVDKDVKRAADWCARAAAQGHPVGMRLAASYFAAGRGWWLRRRIYAKGIALSCGNSTALGAVCAA